MPSERTCTDKVSSSVSSSRNRDDRIGWAARIHRAAGLNDHHRHGRDLSHRWGGEVDEAGKIAAWRDYLDSKEVETKLGAGVSSAGTRPADR